MYCGGLAGTPKRERPSQQQGRRRQEFNFLRSFFLVTPENGLDSQLVHRLNNDTNIVTQYLTEHLVDLRYLFLAHQSCTEFLFDHRERCLDVAPLVIDSPLIDQL